MRRVIGMCGILAGCAGADGAGPRSAYLQQGTHESVVIAWRTEEPGVGHVAWGTDPARLDRAAASDRHGRSHEVRLDGLPAGERIYYAYAEREGGPLRTGDEQLYEVAPPPGADAPIRFWVLGDSGFGSDAQRAVYEAMLREEPADFLVHVGDVAYLDGKAHELEAWFFDMYRELLKRTVVWPALGNHDVRSLDLASERGPYFDAFVLPAGGEAGGVASGTEAYYAFDHGPAHFVVLDTAGRKVEPGSPMLDWLERDLAASGARWKIAVLHHPPYSDANHDSDEEPEMVRVREHVVPILERHGVDLVLAGHSHAYERTALIAGAYETPTIALEHVVDGEPPYEKRGIGAIYVVAGHGGAPTSGALEHPLVVSSSLAHGALLIEIEGDELRGRNVRADGQSGDTFTLIER